MEAARSLFEEYVNGGLAHLQTAVAEEREEHLRLDFKRVEKDAAPLGRDGKECLAVALSGFTNSEGGVVVWGVDCRSRGPDDPDTAQELKPIRNLKRLLTDLQSYTAQLVSPGIIGVEHHPIEEPAAPASGYAITYVPKGEGEPVMAVARGQHTYYYRTGSAFLPMEAFQVADRFGRRPQPSLELELRLEPAGKDNTTCRIRLVIGIRNVGLGVALYPAISVEETEFFQLDQYALDGNGHTGLTERLRTPKRPSPRTFAGGSDDAIYPGTALDVTCARIDVPRLQPTLQARRFGYVLYCQGAPATRGVAEVSYDDICRVWDEMTVEERRARFGAPCGG